MIEYCIRLAEREETFYYSIRCDGVVAETEAVHAAGVSEPDADCVYYGGSQVMD
jgi:hypothetical protein